MTDELYTSITIWLMWVLIPTGALTGLVFSVRDDSFLNDPIDEVSINAVGSMIVGAAIGFAASAFWPAITVCVVLYAITYTVVRFVRSITDG